MPIEGEVFASKTQIYTSYLFLNLSKNFVFFLPNYKCTAGNSNDKTSIIVKDDLYLLGLLNSKAVDFVIQQTSSTKRGGYFEYKPTHVNNLPIANASDDSKKQTTDLVTHILAAKQADPRADTHALEAEIDTLVYQLYGLTAAEIAIVEGKT